MNNLRYFEINPSFPQGENPELAEKLNKIIEYVKTDPILSDFVGFCVELGLAPQIEFLPKKLPKCKIITMEKKNE